MRELGNFNIIQLLRITTTLIWNSGFVNMYIQLIVTKSGLDLRLKFKIRIKKENMEVHMMNGKIIYYDTVKV